MLKLSSDVSDVLPKILKLSSELNECKPLPRSDSRLLAGTCMASVLSSEVLPEPDGPPGRALTPAARD